MKINEVERLAGITKGNIRFYEKEGLLTPGRNSDNGYRDYSEADAVWLKKIRLLRMLGVPIVEIHRMKDGTLTLSDAMSRHRIQLARQQASLASMESLCRQLAENNCRLDTLDVDRVLSHMEEKEQEGTRFVNVKRQDKLTRYMPPVVAAAVMLVLMGCLIALVAWGFSVAPEEAPPLGVIIGIAVIIAVIIIGVLLALIQRLKQIKGGEEDAAAQY